MITSISQFKTLKTFQSLPPVDLEKLIKEAGLPPTHYNTHVKRAWGMTILVYQAQGLCAEVRAECDKAFLPPVPRAKGTFNPKILAQQTSDAYSSDSYKSWEAVARLLSVRGYDVLQAEAILRSKWTRWALNNEGVEVGNSSTLAAYLDRYGYTPTHLEVIKLTREHASRRNLHLS